MKRRYKRKRTWEDENGENNKKKALEDQTNK